MSVSYAEKRKEALIRMKKIGLPMNVITDFNDGYHIYVYDLNMCITFMPDRKTLDRIRNFEQQYKALVYAVIRTRTTHGTLDSYLFVSDYPQEWPSDRQALNDKETMAYVYNQDDPELSEIGLIGFDVNFDGRLSRTW